MSGPPRIAIFTTGGTIASKRDPATGAVASVATAEELLEMVPELAEIANLSLHPFASVNSWNMTPAMMFDLAHALDDLLQDDDYAGAVVTHGTDTVEETALMADLLVTSDKPVAFVVAMRNLSEPSPDGPRNLLDAVRLAADPAARGRGAFVVCNEEAHAARYVTKTNTTNPNTFKSPDFGPEALTSQFGVRWLRPCLSRTVIPAPELASVPLVKTYSGMDDKFLRYMLHHGADGMGMEGSGAGNVPGSLMPAIEDAIAAGIPIVLTSRCLAGFLAPVYGTGGASGGGFDLRGAGVILGHHLTGQKARIMLMVALGWTRDEAKLRYLFEGKV
jgi:L-asparaginase